MKNLHDKLLSRGAASLTDAELLALLVESSDDRRDPRQTAENLLAAYGSLTAVAHAEIGRLRMSEGLGLHVWPRSWGAAPRPLRPPLRLPSPPMPT